MNKEAIDEFFQSKIYWYTIPCVIIVIIFIGLVLFLISECITKPESFSTNNSVVGYKFALSKNDKNIQKKIRSREKNYQEKCHSFIEKYKDDFDNINVINRYNVGEMQEKIDNLSQWRLLDKITIVSLERVYYRDKRIYQIEYIIAKNQKTFYGGIVKVPMEKILLTPETKYNKKAMRIKFNSKILTDKGFDINNPSEVIKKYSRVIVIHYPLEKIQTTIIKKNL